MARGNVSALRAFCAVVASVFVAELLVMLLLAQLPQSSMWVEAVVDATILLMLIVPALYTFVYRPQARHLREREREAIALEAARQQLETEVAARTLELSSTNAQLEATVHRVVASHREASMLAEMTDLLQACRTSEEAYLVIARCTQQLFTEESGALFIFKESRNVVSAMATWGPTTPHAPDFAPEDCWALRSGRPHLVEPSTMASVCPHVGTTAPSACLCVPLTAQSDTLGILMLQRPAASGQDAAMGERRALATRGAEHIALSLSNLRLRETLRHQAIRDALTGLFNRRYLEETLERELHRAERRSLPLAVIMIDVDHFKRFNDTHGHEAGDAVLREVGVYLRTHVRPEDIACRYGGEEFTLILPDVPPEASLHRAEDLRRGISLLAVTHRGLSLESVTVSMGVAGFPAHGSTPETLLRSADQALYRAKRDGRNRVASAELAAECADGESP